MGMTAAEKQRAYRERMKVERKTVPADMGADPIGGAVLELSEREKLTGALAPDLSWLLVLVDELYAARQINMLGRRRLLDEIKARS